MNDLSGQGFLALIFFVLFFIVLGGFLHSTFKNLFETPRNSKQPKKSSLSGSIVISTMPNDKPAAPHPAATPTPPTAAPKAPEKRLSLDESYAASNHMWICGFCETINLDSSVRCAACGHGKNE